ncbi:MAG: type II toxin-antitoxin system RelE/ParE family toxin [Rhodospirillales bacterium]|nr:type II toxin-antitoxin system RelE/ParE family toxin [Rhodospirillales bacterium]
MEGWLLKAFNSKGLIELFEEGDTRRIDKRWHAKCLKILDLLDMASDPGDLEKLHGFHPLKGERLGTYAMSVTANWRVTFRFDENHVIDIDLEDYH